MNISVFSDNEALARQVVSEIAQLPAGARILIPSGSTPRAIFGALAATPLVSQHTFFALDEWLNVPAEMDGSCLSMINADLVGPSPYPVDLVHFNAFDSQQQNIAHYQAALAGAEFDYVILGIGMNGHIGLNEPGVDFSADYLVTQLDDITIEVASRKYFSGTVKLSQGMTVGIGKIVKAKQVIVVVNNPDKSPIFRQIEAGDANDTVIPSVYLKQFDHVNYYITQNIER